MSASSSSKLSSSSKPNEPSADDIEKLLNREATAFQREMEVERILKAFKLKCVPFRVSLAPAYVRAPLSFQHLQPLRHSRPQRRGHRRRYQEEVQAALAL